MSLSIKRDYKVLYDAKATTSTGTWQILDTRYVNTYEAVGYCSLASGSGIIQAALQPPSAVPGQTTYNPSIVVSIATLAASGDFFINKPYYAIRFVRDGSLTGAEVVLWG